MTPHQVQNIAFLCTRKRIGSDGHWIRVVWRPLVRLQRIHQRQLVGHWVSRGPTGPVTQTWAEITSGLETYAYISFSLSSNSYWRGIRTVVNGFAASPFQDATKGRRCTDRRFSRAEPRISRYKQPVIKSLYSIVKPEKRTHLSIAVPARLVEDENPAHPAAPFHKATDQRPHIRRLQKRNCILQRDFLVERLMHATSHPPQARRHRDVNHSAILSPITPITASDEDKEANGRVWVVAVGVTHGFSSYKVQ